MFSTGKIGHNLLIVEVGQKFSFNNLMSLENPQAEIDNFHI
jgi:hypothetical protein